MHAELWGPGTKQYVGALVSNNILRLRKLFLMISFLTITDNMD
jgi:hypothetical protein